MLSPGLVTGASQRTNPRSKRITFRHLGRLQHRKELVPTLAVVAWLGSNSTPSNPRNCPASFSVMSPLVQHVAELVEPAFATSDRTQPHIQIRGVRTPQLLAFSFAAVDLHQPFVPGGFPGSITATNLLPVLPIVVGLCPYMLNFLWVDTFDKLFPADCL